MEVKWIFKVQMNIQHVKFVLLILAEHFLLSLTIKTHACSVSMENFFALCPRYKVSGLKILKVLISNNIYHCLNESINKSN